MAVIETWLDQDLQKPVQVKHLDGNLFSNNGNGNRIGVAVCNNGEPVTLTGTVSGYAIVADGSTVPCTGTLSGNKASILIPPAAYLPGAIFISIFLTDGTTVTTLAAIASTVMQTRTNNQVSPGSVVQDWTQTINAAMQSVEDAAENLGGIIATPYASLTYPVPLGKYTYYNNGLYRCISPIETSEEFTAAHWTQVKLGDDVTDLKSASAKKSPAIYEEIESVPLATFADGAEDMPLKNLKVAIEPVQAGTGDPSPDNVRPITGWTGTKVMRTGKNLAGTKITNKFPSGNPPTAAVLDATGVIVYEAYIKHGGNYTITAYGGNRFSVYVSNKPILECASQEIISLLYARNREGSEATKYSYTLNNVSDNKYIGVYASNPSGGDSVVMIEEGNAESAYEPYQGETYDITFPSEAGTVYGGTLDVATGELVVDRESVDLATGMSGGTTGLSAYVWYKSLTNAKTVPNSQIANIKSESYVPIRYNGVAGAPYTIALRDDGVIYVNDNSNSVPPEGKAIYELATPITYQLTPQEVRTLLGINNVWADAGDVSLLYPADTKAYIDNQIASTRKLIAGIETEFKASKPYSVGDMLIIGNDLYKVSASIASGATITVGTNVTKTTVAEQLIALANA